MASGRAADREDPKKSRRSLARSLDRDPISELHQGPRSYAPHREAGHMTAPDHIAKIFQKTLARGGRPHMIFVQAWPTSGDNGDFRLVVRRSLLQLMEKVANGG